MSHVTPEGTSSKGGLRPAASGLTNGTRTRVSAAPPKGRGFTNGGGRTNGSVPRAGEGFTNGSRLLTGAALPHTGRANLRARRLAAAGAATVLVLTALGAIALTGEAADAPRIDGHFAEWPGHTAPVPSLNPAGVRALGHIESRGKTMLYLEFGKPLFAARQDVWVFLDTDGDASTGYFDGSLGADAAVRVAGEAGKVVATSAYGFSGRDRFDLNALSIRAYTPAAADGGELEFEAPLLPRAVSVTIATAESAVPSGAWTLQGGPAGGALPSLALSEKVRNGIKIDGDFSDWAGVARVADAQDLALPDHLDLTAAAAIGDAASAEFLVDVRAGALRGTIPLRAEPIGHGGPGTSVPSPPPPRVAGTDRLSIYLDGDLDATSGAPVYGIGAEHLLRVEGLNGVVVSVDYFDFDGAAWTKAANAAEAASGGDSVEIAVDAAHLQGARVRFVLEGFGSAADVSDASIEVARQAGAIGSEPGQPGVPLPQTRGGPPITPVPELSDAAAVAAVAMGFALVAGRRRRRDA